MYNTDRWYFNVRRQKNKVAVFNYICRLTENTKIQAFEN